MIGGNNRKNKAYDFDEEIDFDDFREGNSDEMMD